MEIAVRPKPFLLFLLGLALGEGVLPAQVAKASAPGRDGPAVVAAKDPPPGSRTSNSAVHSSTDGTSAPVAPVIEPSGQKKPNEWRKLPANIFGDQKAFFTSPFHMSKSDAKWWLMIAGVGGVLVATDSWTSRQLPNSPDQIRIATWTSRVGAIYTLVPITVGMWGVGRLTNDPRTRETARLSAEALIDAGIVDTVLKSASMRQRPLEGAGNGNFWQGDGRPWNAGSSFPSGHAIYSWALASIFAHEYSDKKWVPYVAYGLATTICASRFAARKHFASDVVIGGAMGWFIGHYVYGRRHNPALATGKHRAISWFVDHVTLTPSFGDFGTPAYAGGPAGFMR